MSQRPQVIIVVGPHLAGVDGVVEELRARLPEHAVVGPDGPGPRRAPDAVVAVVSAVAPMTRSDWDLIEQAADRTALLIGAVSKIDAHRNWREVLDADRALAARWSPHRGSMPWVGVAAAPPLGQPALADLVGALTEGLADPMLRQRNQARRQAARATPITSRRGQPAAIESRVALQRSRLRLLRFVHDGCASMRTDLRAAASSIPAGGAGRLESRVRDDVGRFLAELDAEITVALDAVAAEFAVDRAGGVVPELAAPPVVAAQSPSRRLETRLVAVLGLGFGLGIALASNRVLSGLAPGLSIAGWVIGAIVGAAVVAWVVRTRAVLHDRALLDRWVTEVSATVRWHGEAMIAERLVSVESALRSPVDRVRQGRNVVTDQ